VWTWRQRVAPTDESVHLICGIMWCLPLIWSSSCHCLSTSKAFAAEGSGTQFALFLEVPLWSLQLTRYGRRRWCQPRVGRAEAERVEHSQLEHPLELEGPLMARLATIDIYEIHRLSWVRVSWSAIRFILRQEFLSLRLNDGSGRWQLVTPRATRASWESDLNLYLHQNNTSPPHVTRWVSHCAIRRRWNRRGIR